MPNLLDIMTDEDRQIVKKWAEERTQAKHKRDIPMPFFICAQLGYYYGWDAVVDYRRGYSVGYEEEKDSKGNPTGRLKKVLLSFELEEAVALIEAAKKVHYLGMLDGGRINAATNVSSGDKKYAQRNADYVNKLAESI